MKQKNKEPKDIVVDDKLYQTLLQLLKFFKETFDGKMVYEIPAPGEAKKTYPIVADKNDATYGSETFTHSDYVGAKPLTRKRNLVLVANNSKTVLCQFDLGDCPPHTNPDGSVIRTSHMHLYRKGNASAIAYPLPDGIDDTMEPSEITRRFLDYCNIDRADVIFMEDLFQ